MIRGLVLIGLVTQLTIPLPAQQPTGDRWVDSANVARTAWRQAVAAMNAGDLAAARTSVAHAARAWPTQPAYIWGEAVLAARAADTVTLVRALNAYADLGVGRDLPNEPSLRAYAATPALAAVARRHATNRAPLARSTTRVTFGDSAFWPEGMDYDATTGAYYVASVRHRTIAEVRQAAPNAQGGALATVREILPRGTGNMGAIMGVRVDAARGVLWATTAGIPQMEAFRPADSTIAALLEVRIADGAVLRRFNLPPSPSGHVLGDLAIGPRGDIFATDSRDTVLYRLAPGADSLVAIRSPHFASLQGIAPAPDGRAVYLADYERGILRVDIASERVTRVADTPQSTSLGCDGIVWDRGAIVAVQNGVTPPRVMRFQLNADGTAIAWAEVLDRNVLIADEPTIGAVVGREFVYVANSQWELYDDVGTVKRGVALRRPVLLAVPLPP